MQDKFNRIIFVGYSGHSFACVEIASQHGYTILGYCDKEEKKNNPYNLAFLGSEFGLELPDQETTCYFISIGQNKIRERISLQLFSGKNKNTINLIHKKSMLAERITFGTGNLVMAGCVINPSAIIGNGTILNTASIIEHECRIGDFAHIAPGAVLAGNVSVGNRSFIGANSVIKEGVNIGQDVMVGAGTVVLEDIQDGKTIVGNPGKIIKSNSL